MENGIDRQSSNSGQGSGIYFILMSQEKKHKSISSIASDELNSRENPVALVG